MFFLFFFFFKSCFIEMSALHSLGLHFSTETSSWTRTPGSMRSCLTVSALWRTSHRLSNPRDFPQSCHKRMHQHWFIMALQQCQILKTKQEMTHFCKLTAFPSALGMTLMTSLAALLMYLLQSFHHLQPVSPLHYSVTSTRIHCGSPPRFTYLDSWNSTTSWMLPLCFQCWLLRSEMERQFWIFALLLEAKP